MTAAPVAWFWVYVTAPSAESALAWGRVVVQEHLAACANVVPGVVSLYEWQGEFHEDAEVIVILKTRAASFERLRQRLVELHGYEVPCIVALPIVAGHAPYLQWLEERMPNVDVVKTEAPTTGEG